MKLRKTMGLTFLAAGAIGALFCLIAIIQVWRIRPAAIDLAANSLDVARSTIDATEEGLGVIADLVQTAAVDVALIQSTVQTVTLTLDDTNQVLGSLTTLTGTDLPATIEATQTSLASAQTSAALIDDLLGALTGIPFLGLAKYQPDVPLNAALGEISGSLEPLAPSLATISGSLDDAAGNLASLDQELDAISLTTGEIGDVLKEADGVIADYASIVGDLRERVDSMERAATANITAVAWLLSFLFAVLLFPQFGLAERGLNLVRETENSDNESAPPPLTDGDASNS